ncbi:hypothetical protein ACNS7O_06505 [Haloferacaceae archaeon DSL9]
MTQRTRSRITEWAELIGDEVPETALEGSKRAIGPRGERTDETD